MNKTEQPLVSICVTFFNAGKLIRRILDSSLNQTYQNIEIIIVDDASVDDSEKIISEYIVRDKRVKYFRNTKRIFIIESLLKALELAKGEFVIWPGADDWLSRDFIANGVRNFLKHPDAAGIVPKLISLRGVDRDKFEFFNEVEFPSKIYPAKWFLRKMHKGGRFINPTLYSLVRKEDMVSALKYFLKNYCDDPSLPEEFRKFASRAYGIDFMYFTEILSRYNNFVSDNSLVFIKLEHSENMTFGFEKRKSMAEFIKAGYYDFLYCRRICADKFPSHVRRIKVYLGSETLSTAFIYFLRSGFRPSFLDVRESKKIIFEYFSYFSFSEVIITILLTPLRKIYRSISFIIRALVRRVFITEKNQSFILTKEYFLDKNGNFTI